MNKLSELTKAVMDRIASRSNPTGLTAGDLGAYTIAEMKTKYDTLIPINTLGVSQVGDQSYFPLAIDGAADGAIGISNFRNYAIMREANGDFVGLRTATNAIKRGVYYAIARADANAAITGVTPSSRQFNPGLPAGWEPLTTFGASNDVMWGVALNTSTGATKVYVVKLNGTFDQKQHKASLVDGDLDAATGTQFTTCALVGNIAYIMKFGGNASQLIADLYTIDITNIGNGTTLTSVKATGITSTTVNGGTVTDNTMVLARPWLTNAQPAELAGLMFPRRIKLLTAQQGNVIRVLVEISWYTATTNGLTRDGLILYCLTYDTSTKKCTMNAGASPITFTVETTGHVKLTGASSKSTVDTDFWQGYTRTGAGNNTVNATITSDGVVGVMWNNNNSIPYMASYKLANFTGDPFTELLKLTPQGTQPAFTARPVLDREVGPVTASGHVGFLSKTRVSFTKNNPDNPGSKMYGYADNTWDVTYRYKSDLVDVTGFPPTDRSKTISDISTMKSFMAIMTGPDTVSLAGGVLSTTNLSRRQTIDTDSLLDVATGAAISVTQAELDRIATAALALYSGGNKQSTYDKMFTQLIIPPDSTVPALAIVYGVNYANLVQNWVVCEISPPARTGIITSGTIVKISEGAMGNVKDISPAQHTMQHATYFKASDGWIITVQPNCAVNWVGNTGWFQFILGRASNGSWSYAARVESYTYYSESGSNYGIHPVWGVGYCDCAVSTTMGNAGQIFNVVGNTVAALVAGNVSARYMVLSAIAAAGYNLYVNEPITVLMAGVNYTLPISKLNLQDIIANPSNSTWYLSVNKDGSGVKLAASKTLQANNPDSLINIGTCVTGATQIQTLTLNKTTMLGNNVVD